MNSTRWTLAGVVTLLALLMWSGPLLAIDFEKLIMPGRVIAGHADTEANCAACHIKDSASGQTTDTLCIACHEDVGLDVTARTGFHGRLAAARDSRCIACHTDHEGRDADIVGLGSGIFDHAFTDFPLAGAHLAADCGACHAEGKPFHVATSVCGECHSGDDVHDSALGPDCGACHDDSSWVGAAFDHGQTGYVLTGAHSTVACIDCHRGNAFGDTSTSCASCHSVDDVHAGSKGTACSDCHTTTSWQNIGFDHFRETGFALQDGHSRLACGDCHRQDDYMDTFPNGCVDCHRVDDDHQGRNGRQCGDCHKPTRWSDSTFDHADTGFHLVDAHSNLTCSACHKADSVADVPNRCSACHAVDDSHGGQMRDECDACHSQTEWDTSIAFDHDLTSFPLLGLHATVACGSCHEDNRFLAAETSCAACHAKDDTHAGTLGSACGDCHTANGWAVTAFDHDLHTRFPLDGKHDGLACGACHRDSKSSASDVPSTCGGCHQADDVHDGQFGEACSDCHSTSTFADPE